MKVLKPRMKDFPDNDKYLKFFLAGTIDMGNSRDWQKEFTEKLYEIEKKSNNQFLIMNPRRDSGKGFDSSDKKELNYQILWELSHLDSSDVIIMNLLPESKSPISLMELGLYATDKLKTLFVICPEEYYKYDNVLMVCVKYGIPLMKSEEQFFKILQKRFN